MHSSPARSRPLSTPFFFSSRRRHTRYIGDWSSDVCSSDLPNDRGAAGPHVVGTRRRTAQRRGVQARDRGNRGARSEERRVGKECRGRGGGDQYKRKKEKRRRMREGSYVVTVGSGGECDAKG